MGLILESKLDTMTLDYFILKNQPCMKWLQCIVPHIETTFIKLIMQARGTVYISTSSVIAHSLFSAKRSSLFQMSDTVWAFLVKTEFALHWGYKQEFTCSCSRSSHSRTNCQINNIINCSHTSFLQNNVFLQGIKMCLVSCVAKITLLNYTADIASVPDSISFWQSVVTAPQTFAATFLATAPSPTQ